LVYTVRSVWGLVMESELVEERLPQRETLQGYEVSGSR
jgi:hypothetical protein